MSESAEPVRYIIAANYQHGTSAVAERSKAYVLIIAGSGDAARVVVSSRGGRWITTWVSIRHLGNVRIKSVVELGCPAEVWLQATPDRADQESTLEWIKRNRDAIYTIDRDLGDEDKHP